MGGYPNFIPLYKSLGFEVHVENSMRKARSYLKKTTPDVIVAEYNFQSQFRDRTSNLETLMASWRFCWSVFSCMQRCSFRWTSRSFKRRLPVSRNPDTGTVSIHS